MRRLRAFTLLVIASVVCGAASAPPAQAATIDDLVWLKGCWTSAEPGKHQTTEQWMAPAGGSMLGMSRTLAGERTIECEFMRIAQEADGAIYFVATPSGQPQARFKLIKSRAHEVVFENPAHDFPQRIIYRRQDDGSLLGRIEGTRDGKTKAVDFPMRRVACD